MQVYWDFKIIVSIEVAVHISHINLFLGVCQLSKCYAEKKKELNVNHSNLY